MADNLPPEPSTGEIDPALATAKAMTDAINANTKVLKKLLNRTRWTVGVAIIALFASLVSLWAIKQISDYSHDACVRDNSLRAANVALWEPALARQPAPVDPGPEATPEQRAKFESDTVTLAEFKRNLAVGFAQHAC